MQRQQPHSSAAQVFETPSGGTRRSSSPSILRLENNTPSSRLINPSKQKARPQNDLHLGRPSSAVGPAGVQECFFTLIRFVQRQSRMNTKPPMGLSHENLLSHYSKPCGDPSSPILKQRSIQEELMALRETRPAEEEKSDTAPYNARNSSNSSSESPSESSGTPQSARPRVFGDNERAVDQVDIQDVNLVSAALHRLPPELSGIRQEAFKAIFSCFQNPSHPHHIRPQIFPPTGPHEGRSTIAYENPLASPLSRESTPISAFSGIHQTTLHEPPLPTGEEEETSSSSNKRRKLSPKELKFDQPTQASASQAAKRTTKEQTGADGKQAIAIHAVIDQFHLRTIRTLTTSLFAYFMLFSSLDYIRPRPFLRNRYRHRDGHGIVRL